jgi:hypothetical protein
MAMNRFLVACILAPATVSLIRAQAVLPGGIYSPSIKGWTVEGTVADDQGAVVGVSVHAAGSSQDLGALTDTKGHFTLNGSTPGKYRIYAGKTGYVGGEDGDPRNIKSLDLSAGVDVKDADFLIQRGSSISGRIYDSNRNPVQGEVVVLSAKHFENHRAHLETVSSSASDAAGGYVLSELRAGSYYLSVQPHLRESGNRPNVPREPKIESVPTYYPNSTSLDSAALLNLALAQQVEGLDLVMVRTLTFCVTGKFVAAFGEVPKWARVTVARKVGSFWAGFVGAGNARSDEQFEVCDLPPGSYALSILALGEDDIARLAIQQFSVVDRDVAVGDLYVMAPAQLSGKVIVAETCTDRSALSGIRIDLRSINRPDPFAGEGQAGNTDSNGDFLIKNMYADDYRLQVARLPRGYYVQRISQSGRDVMDDDSIRPGDGVTISVACDGPVVTGQAVNNENVPIPDATVILAPVADTWRRSFVSAHSDKNGRFLLESGVPPGEYAVMALTGLYDGEDQSPEFARDQTSRSTRVALGPRESKSVSLVVHDAHRP